MSYFKKLLRILFVRLLDNQSIHKCDRLVEGYYSLQITMLRIVIHIIFSAGIHYQSFIFQRPNLPYISFLICILSVMYNLLLCRWGE